MNEKSVSVLIVSNLRRIDSTVYLNDFIGLTIAEYIDGLGESLEDCFKRMFPIMYDTNVEDFGKLVLFGEGDCPNCGGDLEIIDGDYKQIAGDYFEPAEFKTLSEAKKCKHCELITNI
jgi:hypothetical protein